jgi:predicted HTH domain antitoxin
MMFRSEQVSAGSACEIAGIDRYTFIEKCKEYDIPVINYSINEIEDELQQYQKISK